MIRNHSILLTLFLIFSCALGHTQEQSHVSEILQRAQQSFDEAEFASAKSQLEKLSTGEVANMSDTLLEQFFQLKSVLHEAEGNYHQALNWSRKLSAYKDSFHQAEYAGLLSTVTDGRNFETLSPQQIEDRIVYDEKLSQQELQTERLKQNIAFGIIIFLVCIVGFIIYYFRQKHLSELKFSSALVNKLEEERGRIARDLHDGVGQSLIILKNKFNKMDSSPETMESLNDGFSEAIEEVRSISRSLIPPELNRLGLSKALTKMLNDIEESTVIIATSELDVLEDITLDAEAEIRIYRIIQELTNNTIKHSHATSLKISFQKQRGKLLITYQDNGRGMDIDSATLSVGLRSIQQRLNYMNGTIKFEKPAKGFRAVMRIKLTS